MRLIDADALLEKMKRTNRYFDVKFDIEEMPTIEAEPVKHGRWEPHPQSNEIVFCSECGCGNDCFSNYCPNCGAKMDLEETK